MLHTQIPLLKFMLNLLIYQVISQQVDILQAEVQEPTGITIIQTVKSRLIKKNLLHLRVAPLG